MGIRVVELFAGVGGFRIGLEGPPGDNHRGLFNVVWSNQWEPGTQRQHAAEVYIREWAMEPLIEEEYGVFSAGSDDKFINKDIGAVLIEDIPEHDLLVGGFPCQDYSVARTLDKAKGLQGKKGVLWWEIHRILESKKPTFALLENVDRLLKSPSSQRGKDFAVMLASLDDLDYVVEWRIIDASEYGFPQRRKRVFILAHSKQSPWFKRFKSENTAELISKTGVLAQAFPIETHGVDQISSFHLAKGSGWTRLATITSEFNANNKNAKSLFHNSGVMVDGVISTHKISAVKGIKQSKLSDVLVSAKEIGKEFILEPESLTRSKGWLYLKGGKKEQRTTSEGFTYSYNEGPVTFPDRLDKPSRTIITGEGGIGPSRFKHVVTFRPTTEQVSESNLLSPDADKVRVILGLKKNQWLRRLIPIELERLNGFPDNHTHSATDSKRAFFMGNALVVGLVEKIGLVLSNEI